MRKKYLLGIALVGVLALSSCSSSTPGTDDDAPGAEGGNGGTIYVLQNSDYSHLDPAQGFDGGVNNFYRLIYRTLTSQSTGEGAEGTEIVPDLATDLGTPNEDATVWTFTLKDDIFFEDGTPITSADVRFGVERSFDPDIAVGSPYARLLLADTDGYEGIYRSGQLSSIETPDEKTIVFHLSRPFADFASAVAQNVFVPFPAEGDVTTTSIDQQPISSGPYKVTEYTPGSSLVLERNEHWSADTDDIRAALPDSFEYTFGLDPATIDERLIADQGKDANAIGGSVQPAAISRIQTPEIQARTIDGIQGCTTYLGLNTTKAPFDQELVRQAVAWAVDKKSAQTGTGGTLLADIAHTMLPPQMAGREDFNDFETADDAGDPEKAKELLAEAGLPDGFSFSLDMRTTPKTQAQAESLQQSLSKAGITVNLNVIDTASYWETIGNTSQQTDAALAGWCPDWANGETFLPPLFEGSQIFPTGNSNIAQFDDPEVNERMTEIRAMADIDEANAAWSALDQTIVSKAPGIPLLYEKVLSVTGSNIAGAYSHAGFSGGIDFVSVGLVDPSK
ncbi:ABC transporter substrate-binding protein [Microbacterium invictum]|uniref:Peptide/nickel transport system substrate-binding protein n=1 Tax=Microbacterium invictum TaxID=515415 RepID=A0AA40VM25_9MICO|nr:MULTISPECIES: ABC transporter substrate-binding protein [Microbacterium]MBB4139966.1 peptide/nickel transport system substrate-binding protein [Microbacterium invictum]